MLRHSRSVSVALDSVQNVRGSQQRPSAGTLQPNDVDVDDDDGDDVDDDDEDDPSATCDNERFLVARCELASSTRRVTTNGFSSLIAVLLAQPVVTRLGLARILIMTIFNVPYEPDYNPIESVFSFVKNLIKLSNRSLVKIHSISWGLRR